jgi:hypothetical protein
LRYFGLVLYRTIYYTRGGGGFGVVLMVVVAVVCEGFALADALVEAL